MGASAPHPHGQVSDLAVTHQSKLIGIRSGPSRSTSFPSTFALEKDSIHSPRSIPDEPATELSSLWHFSATTAPNPSYPRRPNGQSCLLCSYAAEEIKRQERVVEVDESGWLAVVPFWAVWPFELLGLSISS